MPAASVRAAFSEETFTAPRKDPDRESELWLALPKGGKTLGGSDDLFLKNAGFTSVDKMPRVDDYRLVDGPAFETVGVRVFEFKPGDALDNIADGFIDAAIVGQDVLSQFNAAVRGQEGRMNVVRIANLDLAPCALAVAVGENDPAKTPADLAGRTIVTKYPDAVENWARKNGVKLGRVIKRGGGIESYGAMIKGAVIADMVESGASLVANKLRVLGMEDAAWGAIASGQRKFSELSMEEMNAIPGVVVASRAVLVRSPRKMSAEKETALAELAQRFCNASSALGKNPELRQTGVARQRSYKTGRKVARPSAESQGQEIGHGFRNRI